MSEINIEYARDIAKTPGVMIDEVREAYGLSKHPNPEIGKMTINLPYYYDDSLRLPNG